MLKPIRIALFSTINSHYGHLFLRELDKWPHVEVALLITHLDHPLNFSGVVDKTLDLEKVAKTQKIKTLQTAKVSNNNLIDILTPLDADYFLIIDFPKILPAAILTLPKMIAINFHPSLLPQYAGRSPEFWMAKSAETIGGISAIRINQSFLCRASIDSGGEELAVNEKTPLSDTNFVSKDQYVSQFNHPLQEIISNIE